mmetsp:Transcript_22587/g.54570  ORF Transcript_22587/g.54570 Transcript_22587/m.54570 type:complete len:303 (+) Transcript_22587:120-1028(+)
MASAAPLSSPFRPDALAGKVAIVTGGGSGICFEITKQLLLHGCAAAVICGRRENFLQKASAELTAVSGKTCAYRVCDVRDADACQAVVGYTMSTFGRVDILVNGAAGNFLAEAKSLSPKGFKTVMDIDAQGTYNMSHSVYPAMSKGGNGGAIINISMTLHYGATWYQAHASAAKSAIDSLTRSLALEWGCDKIRVNGIAPGPIANTPGTAKLAPGFSSHDMEDMIKEGVPMGRLGTGFDIGMAAVFLACDGSGSYVSGDVLVVDGAEWLYKPPMVPREMVAELSRKVEAKSRALAPKIVSKL